MKETLEKMINNTRISIGRAVATVALIAMPYLTGCESNDDTDPTTTATNYVSGGNSNDYTSPPAANPENSGNDGGSGKELSSIVIDAGDDIYRSNAGGGAALHLYSGGQADYTADVKRDSNYSLSVRYSNDGESDDISVLVNGSEIGNFGTEDTGDWGNGWNNFVISPSFQVNTYGVGTLNISVSVRSSDSYGVEFDTINLTETQ